MKKYFEAITQNEIELLEELIMKDKACLDRRSEQGISLLQYAVYSRNKNAVELIQHLKETIDFYEALCLGDLQKVKEELNVEGKLLNKFSPDGHTPLGLACFFGHEGLAKYLMELGADVNRKSNNPFRVTPLHSACAISNLSLVKMLIEYGALINETQPSGVTALHSAAHGGNLELVKFLINNGANIRATLSNGKSVISFAEDAGYRKIYQFLKTKLDA